MGGGLEEVRRVAEGVTAELLTPALVPGYRRQRGNPFFLKNALTGGEVVPKPPPSHTGK